MRNEENVIEMLKRDCCLSEFSETFSLQRLKVIQWTSTDSNFLIGSVFY